jgi:formylglycine-generating enzyme required for sulfatase activity/WD40 repeat protein/predicted Ser/Thr protein kinase
MRLLICPASECGHTWKDQPAEAGAESTCPACGRSVAKLDLGKTVTGPSHDPNATVLALASADDIASHEKALGRYRIDSELGKGSFGVVYRGYDPQLNRQVAVKVLKPQLTSTPDILGRFEREAQAAANLNHPNIVAVYDTGRDGDRHYITSAFVDGQSLDQHAAKLNGDYKRIAEIVRELAEALSYAHRQKVIHRDVKLQNVMLDNAGHPLLMDFGLARWERQAAEKLSGGDVNGAVNPELTHHDQILGTPYYMSPEQAAGDQAAIGPASDQYSLGILLFRLLTGRFPFRGSVGEILEQIESEPTPRPRTLSDSIPRDLEAICLKTLAKSPTDRYADCRDLATDVERWLSGYPVLARRPSVWERFDRWRRREPVIAGLILGVFLAISTGTIVSTLFARRASERATVAVTALERETAALGKAQEQTKAAQAAQKAADLERARADREAGVAVTAKNEATERADFAEQLAYDTDMQFLQQSWERGERTEMRTRLDGHLPAPGKPDRRGFEWYYWDRLLRVRPGALLDSPHPNFNYTNFLTSSSLESGQLLVVNPEVVSGPGTVIISDFRQDAREFNPREGRTIEVSSGGLRAARITADGTKLATTDGKEIRLWRLPDMMPIRTFATRGEGSLDCLAFDATGSRLAYLDASPKYNESGVRIFDVETGDLLLDIPGQALLQKVGRPASCFRFSLNGQRAALWGFGRDVVIWDLKENKEERLFSFNNPTSRFSDVRWLGDDSIVALGSQGQLVVWSVESGRKSATLIGIDRSSVEALQLRVNRDRTRACVGSELGLSQLWDLRDGQLLCTRRGSVLPPEQALPDRGTRRGQIFLADEQLWDPEFDPVDESVGFSLDTREKPIPVYLSAIAISPDGHSCAVGGTFSSVALLNPNDWTVRGRLTVPGSNGSLEIASLRFTDDGRHLTAAASRGRAALWDLYSGEGTFSQGQHTANCLDAFLVPQQQLLSSCSEARDIRLWKLPDLAPAEILTGPTSFDYEYIARGKAEGTLSDSVPNSLRPPIKRDFDSTRYQVHQPTEGQVFRMALHRDGKTLFSVNGDGTLRAWDLAQRRELWRSDERFEVSKCLALSPQGDLLATGAMLGKIQLWDPEKRILLREMVGHSAAINDIEFSPDGERIATASMDRSVRVWDVRTGQSVLRFDNPLSTTADRNSAVIDLAFHPGGRLIVGTTMDANSRIRIWPAEGPIARAKRLHVELKDSQSIREMVRNGRIAYSQPEGWARLLTAREAVEGRSDEPSLLATITAASESASTQPQELEGSNNQLYVRIPNGGLQWTPASCAVITRPYYLATTEVTVAQFRKFVDATGHVTDAEKTGGDVRLPPGTQRRGTEFNWKSPGYPLTEEHPVSQVSWRDSVAYCNWLTKTEGVRHRLPTEAEWEWACRAGGMKRYHFGDDLADLPRYAWFRDNSSDGSAPLPVGQLLPNSWGLRDMHGNLHEWVHDFQGPFPSGVAIDWSGPSDPMNLPHIARGGAFDGTAVDCSARSYRPEAGWHGGESFAIHHFGFRVLREVP